MSLQTTLSNALAAAWARNQADETAEDNVPIDIRTAIINIIENDSAPNRQMLLAITAGTVADPTSNSASLQVSAGVDRRGQAYLVRDALTTFRVAHGLMFKVSQDAGVSNQWREPEINVDWVARRRKQDQKWAMGFLALTQWLSQGDTLTKAEAALAYICELLIKQYLANSLDYPKFSVSVSIAMKLVNEFINQAPDRPDATEAVIAAATRVLALNYAAPTTVERSDINSPDPIDIVITSDDGEVNTGIEVTDNKITLSKLQHEVVPALTKLGLDRAIVVSRPPDDGERQAITRYLERTQQRLSLQIELAGVEIVAAWLSAPGLPSSVATDFLWRIGDELDEFSKEGNRRAWLNVLNNYIQATELDGE